MADHSETLTLSVAPDLDKLVTFVCLRVNKRDIVFLLVIVGLRVDGLIMLHCR